MTQFEQLPDGIYFDLDEEVYFAQRRLSKSDIKKIRVSPADWWAQSWLNPEPWPLTESQIEAKEKAREIGKAYHYARLEPEVYAARYARKVDKVDYEGLDGFLSNDTEIKAALKALELPQTAKGETIEDRARRLKAAGHEGPIWNLELEQWERENEGKQGLAAQVFEQIAIDAKRLRSQPLVDQLLRDGAGEVSILWTCSQSGLRMSTRLDYLRGEGWVEFKTFANPNDKPLEQCLRDAVMYNGYYIDIAVQLQGLTAAVSEGLPAFGSSDGSPTPEQSQLLSSLAALLDPPEHHIVFQQKGGVPNILARSLELWRLPLDAQMIEHTLEGEQLAALYRNRRVPSFIHQRALIEVEQAKRTYAQYCEIYEEGEPWLPFDPVGVIEDADFPPYWLEKEIS